MRCAKCDAENPQGKRFCGDCGAALENHCPRCGADNPAGKRFCGDCGAPLSVGGDSAPPSSLAQPASEMPVQSGHRDAVHAADGERRHLTVLFSDLVGSTEIAAHMDPEDWREIAAKYQRTAAGAVTRFGGHVAKYLGDGLMVYFGWPEAHEDDAERAVRAGLEIVEEVAALNRRLATEHRVKLAVRVGIQTGSVVMGLGGGEEVDVFGDAPNVASRVQSAAGPNSVLLTAAVHELVSGLFVVEDLGAHQLKGVEHPVQLYRAIQPTAARRRTYVAAVRGQTPFLGRDGDMRLLLSRWERAREGQGQLVLVMGEPGIGKSRLVEEFHAQIREEPHAWVECAGEPFFQSTPFHAVTKILDQGLGWRDDESPEERVTQLERRPEVAGLKLGEAVPLLAELLNLPIPEKYPPLMFAPDQRRKRLLSTLTGWVLNISRLQPTTIAMEDLHWVDPSTLELVQTLVEQAATAPLMLLYTARPEFRAPWPMRAHHAQITLNRLSDRHTREMVADVVARMSIAPDLIDAVVKRTDGVPLFAEELTRFILEGEGRSALRDIPATLHDSLTARLDRLGSAKEIAQVAAVIGREFSYELLQEVSSIRDAELQSALNKLLDAELIYARGIAPDALYQFRHALIQDAAYQALLKSRRRELHERTGATVESLYAECLDDHLAELVHHYGEAEKLEKALEYTRRAGERAAKQGAPVEAEIHYQRALQVLARLPQSAERDRFELPLQIALGTALWSAKSWSHPDTDTVFARAQELADALGEDSQLMTALFGLFVSATGSGRYQSAASLSERMLEVAGRTTNPGSLSIAHTFLGETLLYEAKYRDAQKHLELASSLCAANELHGLSEWAFAAPALLAITVLVLGYPERARQLAERASSYAAGCADPPKVGGVHLWLGFFNGILQDASLEQEDARVLRRLSIQHPVWKGLADFFRNDENDR